jgi:hypothetical protein
MMRSVNRLVTIYFVEKKIAAVDATYVLKLVVALLSVKLVLTSSSVRCTRSLNRKQSITLAMIGW